MVLVTTRHSQECLHPGGQKPPVTFFRESSKAWAPSPTVGPVPPLLKSQNMGRMMVSLVKCCRNSA